MIRFLNSSDDVIAVEIDGLSAGDLAEITERVSRAIDANAQTHVFAEIGGLKRIDWRAAVESFRRNAGLLRKLDRFGRIAVVSDDPLVRGLTRLESALLPNISYEVFWTRERDRALAWVKGEERSPHGPALKVIDSGDRALIAFEYDGKVTPADMDAAIGELEPRLALAPARIRVLARIRDVRMPEIAPLLRSKYIDFKRNTIERVERYALVGGPEWLRLVAKGMAPLVPFELRLFDEDEEADAWAWLREGGETRSRESVADAA